MVGERVRRLRQQRGLTQTELAHRAGVSRQLVGAVEAGRHLPRVDAAVQLARALEVSVEQLFAPPAGAPVAVGGGPVPAGVPLRVASVGGQLVCAVARLAEEGWEAADAVLREDGLEWLPGAVPGAAVIGCDPALGLLERVLGSRREAGLLAVAGSTAEAVAALAAGRVHAGLVHGPADRLPEPPVPVQRWHLAAWRVGLAAPADAPAGWWQDALGGRCRVAQRRRGAASQAAFEAALAERGGARPDGPVTAGHVEATWFARREGVVAVTIEPAAIAARLPFHPLEEHVAELWVADDRAHEAGVAALGEALVSSAFRKRVEAVGGYDLTGLGRGRAA